MSVPQAAVDAVKQRWTWKSMHWPDLDNDQITAVLEAAMPHIREQIASEIEARLTTLSDKPILTPEDAIEAAVSVAMHEGMKLSARIVRKNP